ncbi:MAG TPA: maleylpyruvate isomerase family mycothiol-dependent enzyme [Actinocrinis sp.]|uniref:maleylpyruvate isomerase family mycothiol-dependent enzyme n=1 Tax=Actinocrinis sp. TaxID=1920516 RepID=UPI002D22E199|nr:maleylpyruvate isomerase family mycothiol-dependent enzyme [Actinocrinis sp.]HZU57922.1 maleylpyruvate isomerase family mycothiol-dependent enzyme [Actinocrinis sp.]
MDVFDMLADERRALADLLDQLTARQLATPSLCNRWRVHDVAAHVVMVLEVSSGEFLRTLMTSRGSFDRANDKLTARWAEHSATELTERLRRLAESRFIPRGQGPEAPLADLLVHDLDIRRPLRIVRDVEPDRLRAALQCLVTLKHPPGAPGPTLVPRGCLDGLRLEAEDIDFTWGRGAPVRGAADDLLLAITGRGEGARRLSGPGATTLARRIG